MKVTLDNNVLLSATLWDGSVSQKLLLTLIEKEIELYSSEEILADYKKVLKRDFDYDDLDIAKIMKVVMGFIIIVAPKEKEKVVERDPDDDMIIACAIE
jgi:putative PIN family toxin of toxin-antitoxin system